MTGTIGIDIGGSTTKLAALRDGRLLTLQVPFSCDTASAAEAAMTEFASANGLTAGFADRIVVTGVGASLITSPMCGVRCEKAAEFDCIGRGGLYLSGLSDAIVVSIGTGTAVVHATKNGNDVKSVYLGGTGVGGGTLIGLSKIMTGVTDIKTIEAMANGGDLGHVDLRICDMADRPAAVDLPGDMTAANFGKVGDCVTDGDAELGVLNMIYEVAAMFGYFSARAAGIDNIVLTGSLTQLAQARPIYDGLAKLFHVNYIIPNGSQFATAVGAIT